MIKQAHARNGGDLNGQLHHAQGHDHEDHEVLGTLLAMAGREELMVAIKLEVAERAIAELLDAVRRLRDDQPSR